MNLICKNCNADLGKSVSESLRICLGRLVIECSNCDFKTDVKIGETGLVETVINIKDPDPDFKSNIDKVKDEDNLKKA